MDRCVGLGGSCSTILVHEVRQSNYLDHELESCYIMIMHVFALLCIYCCSAVAVESGVVSCVAAAPRMLMGPSYRTELLKVVAFEQGVVLGKKSFRDCLSVGECAVVCFAAVIEQIAWFLWFVLQPRRGWCFFRQSRSCVSALIGNLNFQQRFAATPAMIYHLTPAPAQQVPLPLYQYRVCIVSACCSNLG